MHAESLGMPIKVLLLRSHQDTVDVVALKVAGGSLQQPPIPALVVRDVGLDLVLNFTVGDQHPFDACYLGTETQSFR